MSWTQPICGGCWDKENPERPVPATMMPDMRHQEMCCMCGQTTGEGIYVRKDPKTVNYPS
jgi:hypothetical protein